MIETKIRIVYKEVEDIYLKKWMANQKKKEEKEKKEQEEQKIMNIKERFKDMTWHFARKGVHVFLAINKTKKKLELNSGNKKTIFRYDFMYGCF